MKVEQIPVDQIHANFWNVNRMSDAMRQKLKRYIEREGLVQPLVVRPHPSIEGEYELLGGEHRWRVCRDELGFKAVPCVIVDLDDRRAKILSVNLNSLSGDTVPSLLSQLLNDLNQDMPIEDMVALLPYEKRDIQDTLSLMQLPEGFEDALEDEATAHDRQAPNIVTLVLDPEQKKVFDEAMERAMAHVGEAKDRRARGATLLATCYLESVQ